MKKILLASSAIVAAAAVSAPAFAEDGAINFNVFTQFHASSTDADNAPTNNGHDFNTNSEIKVSASNTADNGLKYGLVIELETDQGATNNVDENYIWLESEFGRVELGDQDGAANNLFVGGADVGLTYGMIDNPTGSAVNGSGADTAADVADTSDATKITYYTPSFNGFKAAVSYAPDGDQGNSVTTAAVDQAAFEQSIEAGLNYSGTFNDFTLDVGAAGVWADHGGNTANLTQNDSQFWGAGVGFNVGYAGFKVGAGYTYEDGDKLFDNQNSVDAGISYTTGPWLFAVAGVWSETEANSGGTDVENQAISAGVQYEVAPGLAVYGSAITGDYEGGSGDFTSAQTGVLVSF
ncbi:porin [Kiloniella laminariae]|uniref:porin n=1 Tax=Kiloniella laminariae TaxID=454162 RepID=UPI000372C1E0|nr:porin [Kiloniella laminariae]